MQRRALKWALNKKFFTDSDYNQSLIYHNLLPISLLLVRNDLLMLNKIYNCDTALKFDDYWKAFKGPRGNRSAAKQFLRTNFDWKSVKFEVFCFESCKICNCSHPAKSHLNCRLDMSNRIISETVELSCEIKGCEL